ncbi:helix-turn-helix transcriptional regulator [Aliikangiella marina]|uniref:Helix-turn-helix transcriptional regulator n=1 Tax=Aliikangiella marina TaxID=1712262 RepID=A0A545T2G5_9GAMM|nr:helix-turn-helix transcriptional regulator [Aliikangiella marina]TQV71403.1 helix-turn-helix transcriptional regulator [Aliikangiella marina]
MKKGVHDNKYEDLITWLKSVREAKGLTIRDVGRLIDEPHQLVSKVEKFQRKLNVYEFVQYCVALEVDPYEGIDILLN